MKRTGLLATTIMLSMAATLSACHDDRDKGQVASAPTPTPSPSPTPLAATRTIVFVWDGLRPDDVNANDTPNLYALQQSGVQFTDHHSTYPTFTMMNGASFATGSFPATTGFYGNTFWTPPQGSGNAVPAGNGASGAAADYVDPVFTEDYAILDTLNGYYGNQLLLVKSLFATAQAAGITTATIGKTGAAYIQDLGQNSLFVDENTVRPRSLVTELQAAGIAVPANTTKTYADGDVTLTAANGNPTGRAGYATFNTTAFDPDGKLTVTARDSSDASGAPEDAANKYMMSVFTSYILPKKKPMLSLVWFRTPDNVEHGYGPGTANVKAGLRSQDTRLGELLAALKAQGLDGSTNVVIVSDHGHSTVSGPTSLYPLRAINAAGGGAPATLGGLSGTGYSFSGDVRTADLLTYRGIAAFDGSGCTTSAMYGLRADGTPTVPLRSDTTGALCGTANAKYQAISATLAKPVASFKVPAPGALPANGVVVAANGGSDYIYVPSHDKALVQQIVAILQRREEYGAIFVDSRYDSIPGTLPLKDINLENSVRRDKGQPDIVVSFNWDENTVVQGKPGIEFESAGGQRGMHGSFGITDVHNTLIAAGPSFRRGLIVNGPSGNVDVAPTVAWLLGLSMPQADGRVLNEALVSPRSTATATVWPHVLNPTSTATGLTFETPLDPTGATKDTTRSGGSYTIQLVVKDVKIDDRTYRYFDYARAIRQ
ncbi:nucleotide pyrophosphatase/phosphodiesterase family protein [Sphingomonas sp. 8AM]|uniref:nucleotide pyrophosphatase/phosphodiesterase family protein n=1 Tax=Sphingomonas sp. 8AM TaxID=2653170 RepID=UPI0012EEE590|nr:nucleotide pyrophosphatase/phosphodiesterase family protein [Sphingomonas sp. 8AM]VXC69549.1 Type I phosphodiesterase / nucleotide pyrophosphatase [Sphingomonas sp. 8AM]